MGPGGLRFKGCGLGGTSDWMSGRIWKLLRSITEHHWTGYLMTWINDESHVMEVFPSYRYQCGFAKAGLTEALRRASKSPTAEWAICWLAPKEVSIMTPWQLKAGISISLNWYKWSIFTKASCENFTKGFIGETEDVIYIANAKVFHKKIHLDLSFFPSLSFGQ